MKKYCFGLLILAVIGLIAIPASADPLVDDPYITLNSHPTACIQPGETIEYTVHFEGDTHEKDWDPIQFTWDPRYMDFGNYLVEWGYQDDCKERILDESGVFQCRQAGTYGGHTLTMKVKDTVPDNTYLKMQVFAKFGSPDTDEETFNAETTILVKNTCNAIPEFPVTPGLPVPVITIVFLGVIFSIAMVSRIRHP